MVVFIVPSGLQNDYKGNSYSTTRNIMSKVDVLQVLEGGKFLATIKGHGTALLESSSLGVTDNNQSWPRLFTLFERVGEHKYTNTEGATLTVPHFKSDTPACRRVAKLRSSGGGVHEWKAKDGTTIKAAFVSLDKGMLTLRTSKEEIKVKLAKLTKESKKLATQLKNKD